MAAATTSQPPEVSWAQRSSATDPARNFLYLTINAPDVDPSNLKLDLQPTHLEFSGFSKTKKLNYKVKLDFFEEIDPKESKQNASSRGVDMVIRKKEAKEEFWPRLTKEKQKLHFLRTDFDKWVDEDEQDEKEEDPYADMGGMGGMPGMGGMGMEGMGGMGGMGDMGGMGGIDFSKLAAGGGMPDLGSLGGAGDDDEDDEEDEDLPDLEGGKAGEGKAKIEEVS